MSEGKDSSSSFVDVLRWIFVPIVVAAIAWYYTTKTNEAQIEASHQMSQAQIEASTAAADTEYRMTLIDMISKHVADEDPTIALALLALLESLDPDNADRIRLAILKPPTDEVALVKKPAVSAAVRTAVTDDVRSYRPYLMNPREAARLRERGAGLPRPEEEPIPTRRGR